MKNNMKNIMKKKQGRFIVFEGLDMAGKTTIIKEILDKIDEPQNYVYNKGLKSDTFLGKLAPKFPSTFSFMLELAYSTQHIVKPALKEGKTVLQDRYDFSVKSFVPQINRFYNRFWSKVGSLFLLKPDKLFYITVLPEERLKRLEQDTDNKYHQILLDNPELIQMREEKYHELYDSFQGEKYLIDTTNRSIDSVVDEVMSKIKEKSGN